MSPLEIEIEKMLALDYVDYQNAILLWQEKPKQASIQPFIIFPMEPGSMPKKWYMS